MGEDVRGFEESSAADVRVCITCDGPPPWPGMLQCHGCLVAGVTPAATWTCRTVHWDTAVLHAIIRRKVAAWEQACPGWQLVPDMQRYWEDSTHPSKYVDRETSVGRKLAWTRFRVERAHPRGWRNPFVGFTLTVRPGSALYGATRTSIAEGLCAAGLLQPWPDFSVQGVPVMAEEPIEPIEPIEEPQAPEDVPAPEGPAPAAPEAEEAPA